MLTPELISSVQTLTREFELISPARKAVISLLTKFIESKGDANRPAYLNFICTHNSRRSHMAQLWAQAAAYYYEIPGAFCYSGGTEATAFNPGAARAMVSAGFVVSRKTAGTNPRYDVLFAEDAAPVVVFSKTFNDAFNPGDEFLAIMTCSHADETCPQVPGASGRIALTYSDPKEFDLTELADIKYRERAMEIGREMLWAFSQVRMNTSRVTDGL